MKIKSDAERKKKKESSFVTQKDIHNAILKIREDRRRHEEEDK